MKVLGIVLSLFLSFTDSTGVWSCPSLSTDPALDTSLLNGLWYGARYTNFLNFNKNLFDCPYVNVEDTDGTGNLILDVGYTERLTGKKIVNNAVGFWTPNKSLVVSLTEFPSIKEELFILGGDPNVWIMTYSCIGNRFLHFDSISILTRDVPYAVNLDWKAVNEILQKNGLKNRRFIKTNGRCQ